MAPDVVRIEHRHSAVIAKHSGQRGLKTRSPASAYRLHFSCEHTGRYVASSKRRITWWVLIDTYSLIEWGFTLFEWKEIYTKQNMIDAHRHNNVFPQGDSLLLSMIEQSEWREHWHACALGVHPSGSRTAARIVLQERKLMSILFSFFDMDYPNTAFVCCQYLPQEIWFHEFGFFQRR